MASFRSQSRRDTPTTRRTESARPTVAIVQEQLPHYRIPFFEALRERLSDQGVRIELIHGEPRAAERAKRDTSRIDWASPVNNKVIPLGRRGLVWQPCLRRVLRADLVVVEQAARMLLNYALLGLHTTGGPNVAIWGHGFVGRAEERGAAARVRRAISRRAHWWFAYNEASSDAVERIGYSRRRITVVQNSIDIEALKRDRLEIDEPTLAEIKTRYGIGSANLGIFSGALYRKKRLGFLLDAAEEVKRRIPDFELVILGAGPDQAVVERAAEARPWLHYVGPTFGRDKIALFELSKVMLLPGWVGLAVMDSFALEVPLVAVGGRDHPPEVTYLEDGKNGVVLPPSTSPAGYAERVAQILTDEGQRRSLQQGCRASAERYTLREMVERFASGVGQALAAPALRAERARG